MDKLIELSVDAIDNDIKARNKSAALDSYKKTFNHNFLTTQIINDSVDTVFYLENNYEEAAAISFSIKKAPVYTEYNSLEDVETVFFDKLNVIETEFNTSFQDLHFTINKAQSNVAKKTRRGRGNKIFVNSYTPVSALAANLHGNSFVIDNRIPVDNLIIGYFGSSFDGPAIYAPHIKITELEEGGFDSEAFASALYIRDDFDNYFSRVTITK